MPELDSMVILYTCLVKKWKTTIFPKDGDVDVKNMNTNLKLPKENDKKNMNVLAQ